MIRRLLRRWWVRWLVLPPLLLAAAHAGHTLVLKWRFEGRIEALRAAGAPVDLRDLARPRIPDEDNAAALWAEAAEWYEAHLDPPPERLKRVEWGMDLFEEDREEINAWLAKGDPYVDLLARAAARPDLWEGLEWEKGPEMIVTAIPRMGKAADFLKHRIRFAERATPESLRELSVILDLARRLERPLFILMLVRRAVENTAADALATLASKPGFDPREARALLDARFLATEDPGHIREALEGERALGISLSRRWIAGEGPFGIVGDAEEKLEDVTLVNFVYGSWLARPLAYRDALRLLDLMEKEIGLVELPLREAVPRARALREEYIQGPPNVFSHLFATMPMNAFHGCLKHQARMRIARTGLALLELRQTTGAWPESLDAVIPFVGEEWVLDPFTGERLQYEPGVRLEAAVPIVLEDLRADDEIVWRF